MFSRALAKTTAIILTLIIASIVNAAATSTVTVKGDAVLSTIPADAIFCVRLNNLNQTTASFDQFIMGVSPMPVSTGGLIKGQIGLMFGNYDLKGFDVNGSFALFAAAESGDKAPDLFFLLPVTNYAQVTDPNFQVSPPDTNGVSAVGMNPSKQFFIKKAGSFALMARDYRKLSTMSAAISGKDFKNISSSLNDAQLKQASSEPLWAYANMVKISSTYKKKIDEGLNEMKKGLANASANIQTQIDNLEKTKKQMVATESDTQMKSQKLQMELDKLKEQRQKFQAYVELSEEELKKPAADKTVTESREKILQERKMMLASIDEQISKVEEAMKQPDSSQNEMVSTIDTQIESLKKQKEQFQQSPAFMTSLADAFTTLAKNFTQESKSVSIICNPKPTALNLRFTLDALPGTEMAGMFVPEGTGKNPLLVFTEDGMAMNFAARINHNLLKKGNAKVLDLLAQMAGKDTNDPNIVKLKKMMEGYTEASGDYLICSLKIDPNAKPFFDAKYVFEVKDAEKFNKLNEEFANIWSGSVIDDFYKTMGIQSSFTVKPNAEKYKGVSIDVATLSMKYTDSNSQQAMMLDQIYGSGFEYRWAIVNNLWVCRISKDPNALHQLIDQVKSNPTQVCSEMQKAMTFIPDTSSQDVILTYNYLRILKVAQLFSPMPLNFPDMPSKSNLVFGAKIGNGSLAVDFALPKEHLAEMMTAFQMMMQQQMQNMQQKPGQPGGMQKQP